MRRAAVVFAAALLGACSADLQDGHFACGPAGECPSGWFCVSGRCRSSAGGGMDAGPRDGGADLDAGADPDAGPPFDAGPDFDAGPPRPDAGSDAGGCGPCAPNETCVGGTCQCLPPLTVCTGACVDARTDPMRCGVSCARCVGTAFPSCVSGTCVACVIAADCNDGLDCTMESCTGGSCDHTVSVGCLIAGACRADAAPNPDNACQSCVHSAPMTWTNADGRPCDDGNVCNGTEACAGGSCEHFSPLSCGYMCDSSGCCGDATERCCAGRTCGGGRACYVASDTCRVCGGLGGQCCGSGTRPPGTCNVGLICVDDGTGNGRCDAM